MKKRLTVEEINLAFEQYLNNKDLTQKQLADQFGVCKRTIWRNFQKEFPNRIRKISRQKSAKHSEKITDEQAYEIFEKYKIGIPSTKLEKEYNMAYGTLVSRIKRLVGEKISLKEFNKAKNINRKHGNFFRRKIPIKKLKFYFKKYERSKISLMDIAKKLNVSEDTIIQNFRKNFREKYKRIALSRRDERKVTREEYVGAFNEYEKTPISLTKLANSLNIKIGSLRPRFIRLFGDRYHKVAKQKLNGEFLNKRGEIAEKLALEYLKINGIDVEDIRRKCVIKDSFKRPDFMVWETFIEIKSYFVKYSSKKLKGYKEILDSYLNKKLVNGGFLKFGIIISLSGFSEKVWKQAIKDEITLIDYRDLLRTFDNANRQDLIDLLEHHFLPRWEL